MLLLSICKVVCLKLTIKCYENIKLLNIFLTLKSGNSLVIKATLFVENMYKISFSEMYMNFLKYVYYSLCVVSKLH